MTVATRHKMLIGAILVLMLVVTLVKSSNAYASTLNHTDQHTPEVAYDHGYNYFFNAGWAGWGMCISHEKLQSLEHGGQGVRIAYTVTLLTSKGINPIVALAAGAAFDAITWTLDSFDNGNGVCLLWPAWMIAMPIPMTQQ